MVRKPGEVNHSGMRSHDAQPFSPFLVFQYKLPDVYRSMIAYAFLKLIESWLHALFFVNAPIYGASSIFEGFFKGSRGLTKRSALLWRTSQRRLG